MSVLGTLSDSGVRLLVACLLLPSTLQASTAAAPTLAPHATHSVVELARQLETEMVLVPVGSFRMGSTSRTAADDERPLRVVKLQAFHLARFDLTEAQYAVYQRAHGLPTPAGAGLYPVVNVSWDDAQKFIAWLNAASGRHFRLPSEAQWEYAARAGTTTDYWWGEAFSTDHANGTGVKGRDRWPERSPVGSFPANRFGLYDMLGNVWQWTQDCYAPSYQGLPTDGSATGGKPDCDRVLRGGSWCDTPAWMRVSTRNWFDAGERFDYIGVRLAED